MAKDVEALIRDFASDLRELMRMELSKEVTVAVQAALGGKAARVDRAPGAVKTARRSAEDIAKQAAKVLKVIQDNPGSRAEQIARATGISTGDLVAPLKHLLAEKGIKKAGVARGTTYTAKD